MDATLERSVGELTTAAAESTTAAGPGVACSGDGTTGNRIHAVYAVASDRPDRFASLESSVRTWAAAADQVFDRSAAETGGSRRIRFVTNPDCSLKVDKVILSPTGDNSLSSMVSEMKAKGFNLSNRKYLVWADATVYCGMGHIVRDDKPTADNYNNSGRAMYARVDSGCWGRPNSIEAHEVMHTLGGVQPTAPNGTPSSHCSDESDRMCYVDDAVTMTYPCPITHEALFDCGNDDYFSMSPPAGSWLATHWNVVNNAFLDPGPSTVTTSDTTPPPTPTGLSAAAGDGQVPLQWNAVTSDDLSGYRVYSNGAVAATVVSPSHVATGLINGTTYSYAVAAVDSAGNESARSTAVSVTPRAPATTAQTTSTFVGRVSTSPLKVSFENAVGTGPVTGTLTINSTGSYGLRTPLTLTMFRPDGSVAGQVKDVGILTVSAEALSGVHRWEVAGVGQTATFTLAVTHAVAA